MLETAQLHEAPDHYSPSGAAEIRDLLHTKDGEISHAIVPAGAVSHPSWLDGLTEVYYVHAGRGKLWADQDGGEVFDLKPARAVLIPAGLATQFMAEGRNDLTLIVVVMPRFDRTAYRASEGGPWPPTSSHEITAPPPQMRGRLVIKDLTWAADYSAPDGSQIRLLPETDVGGVSHCQLPSGNKTTTVRHRHVTELWCCLDGAGEVARWETSAASQPTITRLTHGVCVNIPPRVPFQFRATGADSLRLLLLTMPAWPGPQEADTTVDALNAWP